MWSRVMPHKRVRVTPAKHVFVGTVPGVRIYKRTCPSCGVPLFTRLRDWYGVRQMRCERPGCRFSVLVTWLPSTVQTRLRAYDTSLGGYTVG